MGDFTIYNTVDEAWRNFAKWEGKLEESGQKVQIKDK